MSNDDILSMVLFDKPQKKYYHFGYLTRYVPSAIVSIGAENTLRTATAPDSFSGFFVPIFQIWPSVGE
ncbi:hypothetical protein AAH678_02875 [Sodalis endosymbiont of Spalangia cameroni]|uniref:hypothetical protein n=1 Tax=Sodalis praecaptivus TaxID=1239307 RepID=UPI0031F9EFEE